MLLWDFKYTNLLKLGHQPYSGDDPRFSIVISVLTSIKTDTRKKWYDLYRS